jgi:hypothetical protein
VIALVNVHAHGNGQEIRAKAQRTRDFADQYGFTITDPSLRNDTDELIVGAKDWQANDAGINIAGCDVGD